MLPVSNTILVCSTKRINATASCTVEQNIGHTSFASVILVHTLSIRTTIIEDLYNWRDSKAFMEIFRPSEDVYRSYRRTQLIQSLPKAVECLIEINQPLPDERDRTVLGGTNTLESSSNNPVMFKNYAQSGHDVDSQSERI